MKASIKKDINDCLVFQKIKTQSLSPMRILLHILESLCEDLSLDFTKALPKSFGFDFQNVSLFIP